MDEVRKYQYISSLILKERLGIISDIEKNEIKAWLQENSANHTLYEKLLQKDFGEDFDNYQRINVSEGLKRYHKRYPIHRIIPIKRWASIAAMLILLLGISLFLNNRQNSSRKGIPVIQPGSSQAVLVLNDGSTHPLNQQTANEIIQMQGTKATNNGKQLCYLTLNTDSLLADSEIYNELHVPRGGEYQVVLADGTRVWLNAKTTLKYPVQFLGKERVVYLEGEAYFEVTKNKEHPFIVMTEREVSVKVLGTSFNVRAYREAKEVETVLEEGSVEMAAWGNNILLKPGQKGSYDFDAEQLEVENVDTENYTAWRNGEFVFNDEKIENIMEDLMRWYDIEIFYRDEAVKQLIFNCKIKKYETIDVILHSMELAGGIHFEVKGNSVVISSKN